MQGSCSNAHNNEKVQACTNGGMLVAPPVSAVTCAAVFSEGNPWKDNISDNISPKARQYFDRIRAGLHSCALWLLCVPLRLRLLLVWPCLYVRVLCACCIYTPICLRAGVC